MKLDIPLARKVLEFAREEHSDFTFDMSPWYCRFEDLAPIHQLKLSKNGAKCGTVACLSGTTFLLAPNADVVEEDGEFHPVIDGQESDWVDGGAELLGLSRREAYDLFFLADEERALKRLENLIKHAEAEEARNED